MPDMPKFEKSSPDLVARFSTVLDRVGTPETTRRPMFGYPCAWIGGNMTTGLFADQWWVNVADPDRETLLAMPGGHQFEVMPGKAMGRYVVMPAEVVADDAQLDAWIDRAITFTQTLPPKKK
jgi:hypothetical protein